MPAVLASEADMLVVLDQRLATSAVAQTTTLVIAKLKL